MAMIVAALLSLSFVTIIPMIKVMIGAEGRHGWVDGLTCSSRYGIQCFVPNSGRTTIDGRDICQATLSSLPDQISMVTQKLISFSDTVAHRFSTAVAADCIGVLDQGRLIAQGRHEELYHDCKLYQNLYKTQLMGTEFIQA